MNVELSISEENGIVKVRITSPDKPVMIETATNETDVGAAEPATSVQTKTVTAETEAGTSEAERNTVSALSEKIESMNREYERVKKAAWRAKKRLEAHLKASGQTVPATGMRCPQPADNRCPKPAVASCPISAPVAVPGSVSRVPEACPQVEPYVPKTVPGDSGGQGQVVTTYNNTNTINHDIDNDNNHVIDHVTDHVTNHVTTSQNRKETEPLSPVTGTAAPAKAETDGNCLPFVPEGTSNFIPLARLPEMYQHIVNAWNNLPLPEKLKGLYPDVAQKLHNLLKEYGETAVQKAIHRITESPFLLGKITNTRGWRHIYFGWLLNPANLKKILENKYRNREQSYDCITYPEYIPWDNVEAAVRDTTIAAEAYRENNMATAVDGSLQENDTNYPADQSFYLDPEYMLKGMDPLTDQARSSLAHAAKLLGLTKTQAA